MWWAEAGRPRSQQKSGKGRNEEYWSRTSISSRISASQNHHTKRWLRPGMCTENDGFCTPFWALLTESPDTDSSKHQIGKGSLKVINNIRLTWEAWDKPGAKLIFGFPSEIPCREPFPPLWRRSRIEVHKYPFGFLVRHLQVLGVLAIVNI